MGISMDILKFMAVLFLIFYPPGHILINLLKKEAEFIEKGVLSMAMGIFLIPQIYYYLEAAKMHNLFLVSVIIFNALYILYRTRSFIHSVARWTMLKGSVRITPPAVFLTILVLAILIIVFLVVGLSGLTYANGTRFYQANAYDSVAQLAMVQELAKNPPHQFPFYSGIVLKGYYVGAFYWRALIQKATNINAVDLFFRYCPMFLLPLTAMTMYLSIKCIMKNRQIALLAAFLIFLTSDMAWVFPILDRLMPSRDIQTVNFTGSLLDWMTFNPPLAHGILIFCLGCFSITCRDTLNARGKLPWILFTGMLFGSLFEYKAFIWAVALPALLVLGLKEYYLAKDASLMKISLVSIGFSALSMFRISSGQTIALFKFDIGHYPLSVFRELGLIAEAAHPSFFNVLASFIVFHVGALGIKILGFHKIYEHARGWKRAPSVILFLIIAMMLSFIFTHLFCLESNYPSATFNFFSIFLLGMSIFSAEAIIDWIKRIAPGPKSIFLLLIISIGIISTVFSFLAYFPGYTKYKVVSKKELEAIDHIKKGIEIDAVILNNPSSRPWISQRTHSKLWDDIEGRDSFISALTGRRTVIECMWHMNIGHYAPDIEARQKDINLFFNTYDNEQGRDLLTKYDVRYVWVDRRRGLNFQMKDILKTVFSNNDISIYKVLRESDL